MNLKGKKVLVTGATGFIGSHLCEALVHLGARVTGFTRYSSRLDLGNLEYAESRIQKEIAIVQGDLRDYDSVLRAAHHCDVIFHLGAIISVPYSFKSPHEFVATNTLGTSHVLSAALHQGVSKVVHTSTSEVYGSAQYTPMDESHPLRAQSTYAASKIGADKVAESYFLTHQLPVTTIRPFNTFGPRQSARAIIPTIIRQALAGDTIVLGSLFPKRDLTYVKDTVQGFIKAAEQNKSTGELINLGTGVMWSVADIVTAVGKILGRRLIAKSTQARVRPDKSEVHRLLCGNKKARRILKWSPDYRFEEGLAETLKWMSTHKSLSRADRYYV